MSFPMMKWFPVPFSLPCCALVLVCLSSRVTMASTVTSSVAIDAVSPDSASSEAAGKTHSGDTDEYTEENDTAAQAKSEVNAEPAQPPSTAESMDQPNASSAPPLPAVTGGNGGDELEAPLEDLAVVDEELAEAWLEPETPARAQEEIAERRILAYGSTAVAVLAFGAGGTIGYLARDQYDCLRNILSCNENLPNPVEGTEYLDQIAEMEQKAVLADMLLVLGVASSLVAITNWVQGFLWTPDEQKDANALDQALPHYAALLIEGVQP